QVAVIEGSGYTVRDTYVAHVNNQYIRKGEIDPKELTIIENVTERVMEEYELTHDNMAAALSVAKQSKMPDPDPALAGLGSKKAWLEIYSNLYPLLATTWPDGTEPAIDKRQISEFLDKLNYPLYFLDYETMQGLVPYFDGQRPYQQIPFQYSLHI